MVRWGTCGLVLLALAGCDGGSGQPAAPAATASEAVTAAPATVVVEAAPAPPPAAIVAAPQPPPAAVVSAAAPTRAAADPDAAQALFKANDCTKCHAVDKVKKGPSLKKIAADLRGKADAQDNVIKNITTGPKIKLADGTEQEHKIIDSKDQKELKNLADWILSQ
ncbi:MAG: c-type cytochrome [Rhodoferax sp.]|nr:c-type cytochrome [Rhodoferax sp.]